MSAVPGAVQMAVPIKVRRWRARAVSRDLHDGTQQRLVSLGLAVRAAEATVPADLTDLRAELSRIAAGSVMPGPSYKRSHAAFTRQTSRRAA